MKRKHNWKTTDHGTHVRHVLQWDELRQPEPAESVTDLGNAFEIYPRIDSGPRLVMGAAAVICLALAAGLIGFIVRG